MKLIDKAAKQLSEMMIKKIECLQTGWNKPWISRQFVESRFRPCNLSGREYSGGNLLMLFATCEAHGYKTPVFTTRERAAKENVMILRTEKPFPVFYSTFLYFHKKTNKRISQAIYLLLSPDARKQYKTVFMLRYYFVYNLDQTNFREVYPEKWEKILAGNKPTRENELPEDPTAYKNPVLDTMLVERKWVCPVRLKEQDKAYYSPLSDYIMLPLKKQFLESEAFYGTMLHEMAHSTGHETRLKREILNHFGSEKYAREELVAEFSSALCGLFLGIPVTLQQNNAAYLKSWLQEFNNDSRYLLNVLNDCTRVTKYVCDHLEINKEEETEKIAA